MPTPNIVPKADQEGGLGTAAKSWGKLFIKNASGSSTVAATISNLANGQVALYVTGANTTKETVRVEGTALTTG